MSHFLSEIASKVEKGLSELEKGVGHARDEAIGILHPNRRHDEPAEIMADERRTEIADSHRFQSFAPERTDNFVKWHIDGHDYMWALSELLENAQEVIMILDWWLTPELYLRRPPGSAKDVSEGGGTDANDREYWRLDRVLYRKASQGVRVHIVVYKEVTQTMNMDSSHTKNYLESLHENIAVLRHPDHIGSKDTVEFWSHHEKLVIVDNHFACVGGLDLCFGRWDTHTHPLADVHPTQILSKTLFPGQDYNNARVLDFQHVEQYWGNELDVLSAARMPWHDVHMTLNGPSVLDLAQHFVERWNEIRRRKYLNDPRVIHLAFPHNTDLAPNEPVARHPHREMWAAMGKRYRQMWHWDPEVEEPARDPYYKHPRPAPMRIQVVRSACDWSHGILTEHSIQNAYIQLINEASHFIYIENQFFISATAEGGVIKNQIAHALVNRIVRAAQEGAKFKVIICIPEVPGFPGAIKDESSLKIIMAAQYRTINRGGSSIYECIRKAGYDPEEYIKFYHLRGYDRINAPGSYIAEIESRSGVSFHDAQVALARLQIGDSYAKDAQDSKDKKEVTITLAVPTTEALVVTEQTTGDPNSSSTSVNKKSKKTVTVAVPPSEEAALDTLRRFEQAARQVRHEKGFAGTGDDEVSDNVAQHSLLDNTSLLNENWLGTEEEELAAYVSEVIYIHTKLMIVDDRRVIMGSANINDRSQKGDGDSEIALVVEDNDLIHSTMDGRPYMAARFAATLRRRLFKEHLGLIPPQWCPPKNGSDPDEFMRPAPHPNPDETDSSEDQLVADPLSDDTQNLWNGTAKKNRDIFTEIFRPVPTNLVRDWKAYENYVPKIPTGHVAPGVPLDRVKQKLGEVRGAVVECPLDFLIDEKGFVEGPDWLGLNPTLPIYI